MARILVTGGAGYIGSHTVKELLRRGHQPIVYDDLRNGHRAAVKNCSFVKGDLADLERLRKTFRSDPIDAVMHFAGDCLVGESVEEPKKYFNNNVRNGLQLLEIMEQFNVKKFVFSSSAAVYGEPDQTPIDEDQPCLPSNPYGETKWVFEKVLDGFSRAGKLNYVSLRYFNAAGADPEGELGEDHSPETHLIPLVLRAASSGDSIQIFGTDYETPDGTCIRDYIHVGDLAKAHVLAMDRLEKEEGSGIYNLGNGNGYSVREVIETAKKATGRSIPAVETARRPGDPPRLVASAKRIRRELGWVPEYPSLETIIETAWKWHRKHPNGYA
jgi:UDP-glucose 4-epimerase